MGRELIQIIRSRKKATLALVGANILVFLVLSVMGNTENASFMYRHGACWAPDVEDGEYWRLVTSMFMHFGVVHLMYNMLCLFTLGDLLERIAGTVRYLIIYLAGGLIGNVVSVVIALKMGNLAVSAGASGCIFAVIGALLWLVILNNGRLGGIRLDRMILMIVLMAAQGFVEGGTDNAAHLGGLAAGFLLGVLLLRKKQMGGRPGRTGNRY